MMEISLLKIELRSRERIESKIPESDIVEKAKDRCDNE